MRQIHRNVQARRKVIPERFELRDVQRKPLAFLLRFRTAKARHAVSERGLFPPGQLRERFQLLQSPGSLSDQTFPLQANK